MSEKIAIRAEISIGTSIQEAAEEMAALTAKLDCRVLCDFNDLVLVAEPGETAELVLQKALEACPRLRASVEIGGFRDR